jgi:hypothetical protein
MPACLLTGGLWIREVAFKIVSISDAACIQNNTLGGIP